MSNDFQTVAHNFEQIGAAMRDTEGANLRAASTDTLRYVIGSSNQIHALMPPEPSDLDRVVALAQALLSAGMDVDLLLERMMRVN